MHNVFVYGTLMVKEVANAVIGFYATEPAKLLNYQRLKIFFNKIELPYPALIYNKGKTTNGILFRNLNEEYIDLLDQYEGEDYSRIKVNIQAQSEIIEAWVYVWNNPSGAKLNGNWDINEFIRKHLLEYLNSD